MAPMHVGPYRAATATQRQHSMKAIGNIHAKHCGAGAQKRDVLKALQAVVSGWSLPPEYDYSQESSFNYRAPDLSTARCLGRYKEIRGKLDADYHGIYCAERQAMQDELIGCLIDPAPSNQKHPWIMFTAGPMGGGKSHTIHWMWARGIFPLEEIVQIDFDIFKLALPEWSGYVERNPKKAGMLTRRESGYLVEVATAAAMKRRKHVWVDGSLRDGEWYEGYFRSLRANYPDYRIAIIHVTASEQVVFERVRDRAEKTGRDVPEAEVRDSIERVPKTVDLLSKELDFLAVIDNSGAEPQLIKYCDEEMCYLRQECWDQIKLRFSSLPTHRRLSIPTTDEEFSGGSRFSKHLSPNGKLFGSSDSVASPHANGVKQNGSAAQKAGDAAQDAPSAQETGGAGKSPRDEKATVHGLRQILHRKETWCCGWIAKNNSQ